MTDSRTPGDLRGSKKREAAREKARALREERQRAVRRKRIFLVSSLGIVIATIVAGVVIIVATSIRPPATGPENMASDGILIGEGLAAEVTPALQPGESPTASPTVAGVADIRVYFDYMCPFCGQFEQTNSPQMQEWVNSGLATVEYHPLALFDRASQGTKYSTRAANAAACVANYSPNNFWDVNKAFFENQPDELSEGLTDSDLKTLIDQAGVEDSEKIEACIDDATFTAWTAEATSRAMKDKIPGTDHELSGTPLVVVNGQIYDGPPSDAAAFKTFAQQFLVR